MRSLHIPAPEAIDVTTTPETSPRSGAGHRRHRKLDRRVWADEPNGCVRHRLRLGDQAIESGLAIGGELINFAWRRGHDIKPLRRP